MLDSRKCISYHTIENRGPIPRELRASFGDWVFGCDACLDSCPVGAGRFESHPDFIPATVEHARPALAGLLELDETAFSERFRGRAIMRAKRDGLVRNACVALGNVGTPGDAPALAGALRDTAALVRGHAAWGLAELSTRFPDLIADAIAELENALAVEQDEYVREEITLALQQLSGGVTDGRTVTP